MILPRLLPFPLSPFFRAAHLNILLWVAVEDKFYVPAMPVTLNNVNDGTQEEILKPGQSLQQTVWKDV